MNPISDFKSRVQKLPTLADTFGTGFTFGRIALKALKRTGDPRRVNWDQVHRSTIVESIELHGQDPDDVHDALSKHSPGAVSPDKQNELRVIIDQLGPDLAQRYDQARAKQDADYAREKAATDGKIKFIK